MLSRLAIGAQLAGGCHAAIGDCRVHAGIDPHGARYPQTG